MDCKFIVSKFCESVYQKIMEGEPFPEIFLNKCEMLVSLGVLFTTKLDMKWLSKMELSHPCLVCFWPLVLSRIREIDIWPSVPQSRKYKAIAYQNVILTFNLKIFTLRSRKGNLRIYRYSVLVSFLFLCKQIF